MRRWKKIRKKKKEKNSYDDITYISYHIIIQVRKEKIYIGKKGENLLVKIYIIEIMILYFTFVNV